MKRRGKEGRLKTVDPTHGSTFCKRNTKIGINVKDSTVITNSVVELLLFNINVLTLFLLCKDVCKLTHNSCVNSRETYN